jgi:hypothetical protein
MFEENQMLWGAETRTTARHKQQLTQSLAADVDREPDDVAAGGRRTVADETGEGRVSDDVGCRRPHHARGVRRLARSMTTPTV